MNRQMKTAAEAATGSFLRRLFGAETTRTNGKVFADEAAIHRSWVDYDQKAPGFRAERKAHRNSASGLNRGATRRRERGSLVNRW